MLNLSSTGLRRPFRRLLAQALAGLALLTVSATAAEAANPVLLIQATGSATGGSDVTAFIDQVEIVRVSDGTVMAGAVTNPSFENTGVLANGNYGYNPSGASWAFNSGSGIAQNGSAFGPTATAFGTYVAFLQNTPSLIQQTLVLANGAYQVRFQVSQRNCCSTNDQGLSVLVNGAQVGTVQPANNGTNSIFTSNAFIVGPSYYQALTVSGYTADVVANGTNLPVSSTVSTDFDDVGYNLMERGFSNSGGSVATQGLPPGGIINSALTAGLPFQLASYSASNSLRLPSGASGTLTLAQPRAVNTLYVLAATGSGDANMTVTVRYTDGSTELFSNNSVPDWFGGANYAILGLGRTNPSGDIDNITDDPRLYQTALALSTAGHSKPVASVGFTNAGGGVLNVMGLSAESASDLVINTSGQLIPVGNYTNITVTGTGQGTLMGPVQAQGALLVQTGGSLNTNCQALTGASVFTLQAGATLSICDPAGLSASGATGAVQTTGTRSFSTDASYVYNGTATQATGTGLPTQVRNLTTINDSNVTLSAPTSVTQVLTLSSTGNLVLGGNALTLLSNSIGTALVVNSGTGVVGGTATVQRFIASTTNAGPGYRHYAVPVSNTTVADLATAGFSPEVSQAAIYNASATPGTTTPFPTVFGYDQSRVSLANSSAPFDRGFVVPADLTTPLAVGQGYVVNIAGNQLVDFVGTLTNGDQSLLALSRVAGNPDAGWQLLGNPYPAPLDYALVAPADRVNLDGAIYVYGSTGPYVGTYRSYVNGVGGNSVLPMAQAFFVRVSDGQTSGALTFRNSQRLTSPEATAFQRGKADTRPLVQLELRGTTGPVDTFYAYATAGATPAFDSQLDAVKLPNTTGLNLASLTSTVEGLAIDARPAFTAATVLPLTLGVPGAGAYTLSAAALMNLPVGLDAYLHDAVTGQTTNLSQQPRYAFAVSPAQAQAGLSTRFSLGFRPQAILATHAGLHAGEVSLFPNPAHASFTVLVPAITGTSQLRAELLNALGQVVRRLNAALPGDGASLRFDTAGLAGGIYILRLSAGPTTLTKRVVLQ